MRLAAWFSIAFAVMSAVGVFLPGVVMEVGGVRIARKASVSLYRAAADRELARSLLQRYARSGGRQTGEKLADKLLEHGGSHARKLHVDDARDAMSTLDEVSDDDVKTAGRALVAITAIYLALAAVIVALLFGDTMRGAYSKRRAIVTVVLGAVLAAIAIAVHVGWSAVAFEANDELGVSSFALGIGAWVMPVCAVGALASAIALLVLRVRAKPDAQAA